MPSEKESGALREILRNIKLAEQFTQGHTSATLQADDKTLYAVVRSPEIISEASRRLTDELKARHTDIEWREMAAAGNLYRHSYEDITASRVWKTLHDHLPALRTVSRRSLAARLEQ